ncbi:arsenate reductase ArsC [Aestuariibius sp. 2305UL40-4]|uniref:arsenate reductase ArsC n=1 Tax=Aestuariibius violaceus TaxID=3234132 RepID=UPI00345E2869
MNILVLCTGNSARSILLEMLLDDLGQGRVTAYSAGSKPAGKVHPYALKLLEENDYDTSRLRSKSWDEFAGSDAPEMDIVITVCGSAAEEACPIWPGTPIRAHWGVEDPAAAPEDDWPGAFGTAYRILKKRTESFLAQPIETLDEGEIKALLSRIGRQV